MTEAGMKNVAKYKKQKKRKRKKMLSWDSQTKILVQMKDCETTCVRCQDFLVMPCGVNNLPVPQYAHLDYKFFRLLANQHQVCSRVRLDLFTAYMWLSLLHTDYEGFVNQQQHCKCIWKLSILHVIHAPICVIMLYQNDLHKEIKPSKLTPLHPNTHCSVICFSRSNFKRKKK